MPRSNIIKDFVSKQSDLDTTLKRLKVILYSLEYQEALEWLDKELNGYSELDELPSYRIFNGQVYGNYINGLVEAKNQLIPIEELSKEWQESIKVTKIYNDIETLQNSIDNDIKMGKPLSSSICSIISKKYGFILINANVIVNTTQVRSTIKQVEKKTLDILLELEKEFGNLDELDIDLNNTDRVTINEVNKNIIAIIYDKSVSIGSDNSIEESTFNA